MKYSFTLSDKNGWNNFFCENGFVVIRGIFSSKVCDKFLAALKKYADKDFSATHNIERDPPEGHGLKMAEGIYKNSSVVYVLDTLCGAEVVALGNQTLFKEAGSRYANQAWNPHQDNSYPQTPNGEYTTINIFLANADKENGGMYIYPGSQKEGLLPYKPTVSFRENPSQNPGNTVVITEKYKDKKIDLRVSKGDVLVLHGHVIHGSYSNNHKTRSRPLFSVSYVPRGTKFISGKHNKRKEIEVANRQRYVFNFKEKDLWKKFYNENGFVVLESLFDSMNCDEAVRIYEKYALPDFRGIMNLDRGGQIDQGDAKIDVDSKDANTILTMLKNQTMLSVLKILQSSEMVLLQSMLLFKRAKTPYAKQAWNPHQDNAYVLADYGMYITGNIVFSDQDPENGGMYIYPGSHREPILPNKPVKSFHEGAGTNPGHCIEVPEKYKNKKTDLIIKKGGVLFLHGNVIHGSYPNLSKTRSRPMLLIPYGTKGISQGKTFIAGKIAQRKEMPLQ